MEKFLCFYSVYRSVKLAIISVFDFGTVQKEKNGEKKTQKNRIFLY